jgi:hypothetical protein
LAKFVIRHDLVRERKGLKSWGVFEDVGDDFSKGISQHATFQEAIAAKAVLEEDAEQRER